MIERNYKKYFLWTLIAALSISALIGIIIFQIGNFGEKERKLLFTTLTLGVYSLTGLCSSKILNRPIFKIFSIAGMVISFLGFLTTVAAIWEMVDIENIWKIMVIFFILSFSFGHISLILLIRPAKESIKILMIVTILFITLVAFTLIKATLVEFSGVEWYYRQLGVCAILDILGTIATPILNISTEKKVE
jgi:hypothetical protein